MDPASHAERPAARWQQLPSSTAYGRKFAALVESGADIHGEARLADALAPRGATILDAGSGMGRVGAALVDRGHHVIGIDLDEALLEQSRETFPQLPAARARLEDLTPDWLVQRGHPSAFDLVVCVGNVMTFLAPGSERQVLQRFADLLGPQGRVLVGFDTASQRPAARRYPVAEFRSDVAAAGLRVQSAFSSFELHPLLADSGFLVAVLDTAPS